MQKVLGKTCTAVKSKVKKLMEQFFGDFEWVVYFRRPVLVQKGSQYEVCWQSVCPNREV